MGHEYVSAPLLELRGVTVRYRRQEREEVVLRDFSLSIELRELLCVLGPSGCGKTTLLKVAGSFLHPLAGRVLLEGLTVGEPDPGRVMVFQDQDQLFPWKSVMSNVRFGLRGRGRYSGTRADAAARALQEVGLADAGELYPHQLSGGMRQRVALARAFVGTPRLLLLDEPFGSVDAPQRRDLQLLLQRLLQDHESTAIFVTHDVEEAIVLGTRIIVLRRDGSLGLTVGNPASRAGLRAELLEALEDPGDRSPRDEGRGS